MKYQTDSIIKQQQILNAQAIIHATATVHCSPQLTRLLLCLVAHLEFLQFVATYTIS